MQLWYNLKYLVCMFWFKNYFSERLFICFIRLMQQLSLKI
jgi:hypothetical protein